MPEVNISNKIAVSATVGGSKKVVSTKDSLLEKLCKRPEGLTEVRRDGKDTDAVVKVITEEYNKRRIDIKDQEKFEFYMKAYVNSGWATMESLHEQMLKDNTPANEIDGLDKDYWYEINLTNASLFSNLKLKGKEQLVQGRLFTTRMPFKLIGVRGGKMTPSRNAFLKKCRQYKLKVICVLAEPHEFEKGSGRADLDVFYQNDCKLKVYNPSFVDYKTPSTETDLIKAINDLTYELSQGENCLIHCMGGTGRTGLVVAAILQNLGVYDAVARIRRVKSTYVETKDQEAFLKNLRRAIDKRIIKEKPQLARAIAADHLVQLFHTYCIKPEVSDKCKVQEKKKQLTRAISKEDEHSVEEIIGEKKDLSTEDEQLMQDAFGQLFDLIDLDKSGTLDNAELEEWLHTYVAEVNAILGGEECTRDKFVELMFMSAKKKPEALLTDDCMKPENKVSLLILTLTEQI